MSVRWAIKEMRASADIRKSLYSERNTDKELNTVFKYFSDQNIYLSANF